MKKKDRNILDLIPLIPDHIELIKDSEGAARLKINRVSRIEKFVTRYFKIASYQTVDLDEMGSVVMGAIDGKRTVNDIAMVVKDHFGDTAEPLYERLIFFFKALHRNKFVTFPQPQE